MPTRRQTLAGLLALTTLHSAPGFAQTGGARAFPYYSGEDALRGLYASHLPPLAARFQAQAQALLDTARRHCAGPAAPSELRAAWRATLLAWAELSTPALGPVLERRSQRQIDFWPPRLSLIEKALQRAPRTLADMERVGTPAKGLPALERLLVGPANPALCPYIALVADAVAHEAHALREGFERLAVREWDDDEEAARTAFGEWINQWLGGLERLRWAHIEQPVQKVRTVGKARTPEFARLNAADNQAEWRAQWQALRAQARLTPAQQAQPPLPGQGLIPIEALLMGKGRIALAQRWAAALDNADAAFARLPVAAGEGDWLALARALKAITSLYQAELAAALDVPLGFSDADGD